MSKEFILKAVTPEGLVFEKPVTFAKVRTENGDIGILPNHINLVSLIGAGEMIVREKDKKETVRGVRERGERRRQPEMSICLCVHTSA